MLLSYDMLKKI